MWVQTAGEGTEIGRRRRQGGVTRAGPEGVAGGRPPRAPEI